MAFIPNTFIEILTTEILKDNEGFGGSSDTVIASVRAFKTLKSGNEKNANDAEFANETYTFTFRRIPNVTVTTSMYITDTDGRYGITAVDSLSGKGMYIDVTASKIYPSKGGMQLLQV